MAKLSFLDKLKALFELVFSSSFFLIIFISVVVIIGLFLFSNKINKKIRNIISFIIYFILIGFIGLKYGKSILNMLDNLVDNIFSTIYFPSLVSYIVMQLITNVIVIVSIISKKMEKLVRNINLIVFVLIQFLFVLILDVIISNNIDVYSALAVYTNTNLLSLIELSMLLFVFWIITLLIIKAIDVLNSKMTSNKKVINSNNQSIEVKVVESDNNQLVNDEIVKDSNLLVDNIDNETNLSDEYNIDNETNLSNEYNIDPEDEGNLSSGYNIDDLLVDKYVDVDPEISLANIPMKEEEEVLINNVIKEDFNDPSIEIISFDFPKNTYFKNNNIEHNFNNVLNEQFNINNNHSIDFTIEQILNKPSINLEDYKLLRKLLDDNKVNNNLTQDQFNRIISKLD